MKVFIFLLFLLIAQILHAQNSINALAFPSANNGFLGRTGSGAITGVDLYTGTLQVTVPVCDLSSKDLTIPVSLSYVDGRGVKVQEYASQVGLGWQLNAGGGISRVVRGFPDEQPNGYLGNGTLPSGAIGTGQQWGKVVASQLGNMAGGTAAQYTAITGINTSNGAMGLPTADGEPDIFYVKTPYFSFQFSFDENGNPIFPNSTGMKVNSTNFINSYNYGYSSFEVIDDQGNQYYFGSTPQSVENTTATLLGSSYTFPTTWYLDKIVSFNSKEIITLTYSSFAGTDQYNHYIASTYYDYTGHNNTDNTPIQTTVIQPKMVSSIVSTLGEIDFTYTTGRRDDNNAVQLSSILLKPYSSLAKTNTTLKTFNFNYSYFGDPSSDPNVLRLRLDNITIAGNTPATSSPVILKSFTYNTSVSLPSRQSLSAVDYFGYNSYSASTNTYNISLAPNLSYAVAATLNSVKDITGSSTNFYYELNDYLNPANNTNTPVGGLRVNKISETLPSGESLFTTYSYVGINGKSTGQILSNSYLINIQASSCGVNKTFSESPSDYNDLNGNFVGYSSVKATNQTGGYTISAFSNFSNFPDSLNYPASNPNGYVDITSSISLAYKRGLLLDQAVYDASNNLLTDDATPLASYISLTSPVQKKSWAFHWANLSFSVSGSGYANSCAFAASSVYWMYVENFRPTKTIHTDYDQVNRSASIQKTISYTYSTVNNRLVRTAASTDSKGQTLTKTYYYPDDSSIPMVSGTSEQPSITGLLTANRTNVPIHETDNRNGVTTQIHNSYSTTLYNNIYLTQTSAYTSDPVNTGNTLVKQQSYAYDPITSNLIWSKLLGGKPTGYLYGYKSALPVAKVINAVNAYTTTMVSTQKFIDVPLVSNNASTFFTSNGAGDIVLNIDENPGATYTVSYSLSGPSNQSGNLCISRTSAPCYFPQSVTFSNLPAGTYTLSLSYNNGSSDYMGVTVSYYATQPATTVTPGFFYEGFEDSNLGTIGSAHTGNAYYSGTSTSYSVNFSLPDSRSYIIQWWSWLNGKWSMHQQSYTGPMNIPGIIDDVRVFPSDALMSTISFNPIVGKTGESDPAGRTITTEYDGLGRINLQRDDNKNILTKNCYSYAGQSITCPVGAIYSNAVQQQSISRINCGSGYVGGTVTYTVPAGTYTSTISQADANQQAFNDIATNGQNYANTNGACTPIWYNIVESGSYTRSCPSGYAGSTVMYTVPANTYSSLISQADANQKAINDVLANGQNYANTNGTCTPQANHRYGDLALTGSSSSVSFTSTISGTITLTIDSNPGSTYSLYYTLSGPSGQSGTQCISRSSQTCSYPSSATFNNMPAGTYTLTIGNAGGSSDYQGMSYSYYGQ